MKSRTTILTKSTAAVAALMLASWGAMAAEMHARGTVSTVDAKSSTFSIQEKGATTPQTFHWTASTHFVSNGKAVTGSELKSGELVHIQYEKSGNTMIAKEVMLRPGESKTTSTSKH